MDKGYFIYSRELTREEQFAEYHDASYLLDFIGSLCTGLKIPPDIDKQLDDDNYIMSKYSDINMRVLIFAYRYFKNRLQIKDSSGNLIDNAGNINQVRNFVFYMLEDYKNDPSKFIDNYNLIEMARTLLYSNGEKSSDLFWGTVTNYMEKPIHLDIYETIKAILYKDMKFIDSEIQVNWGSLLRQYHSPSPNKIKPFATIDGTNIDSKNTKYIDPSRIEISRYPNPIRLMYGERLLGVVDNYKYLRAPGTPSKEY